MNDPEEQFGMRVARLMFGDTPMRSRRVLPLAFNREQQPARAHRAVARWPEGAEPSRGCRVVVLLHPEWNPGVVEQQIGRVDRINSRWSRELQRAIGERERELPQIEIRPVIFQGTYDNHHLGVLRQRQDDLRLQLIGIVIRERLRDCLDDKMKKPASQLNDAGPKFRPPS
jgi:hypothetical protein